MNPLYTEFKRKFSLSMYKNMGISLGEMSFYKDFVNDTRGDLYPLLEKSEGCRECVGENRYCVSGGSAERVFCQLFPYASYELALESLKGAAGFTFRLPNVTATVTLACDEGGTRLSYECAEHKETLALPEDFTAKSPWLVTLRPGVFDIYYRKNGGANYVATVEEPALAHVNRYADFKDGYVSLTVNGEACVKSVTSSLDNGISIADFRPLKYEDGTVIQEGGRVYFSASIRQHAGGYQAIFSWVPGTMQLEMTGALFFDKGDGYWRSYIASTLVYHREKKTWYVWTSSFGNEHILAFGNFEGDPRFGIGVIDVTLMEKATEKDGFADFVGFSSDEDPDLVFDAETGRWILAICRIDKATNEYCYAFFSSTDPLRGFRFIGRGVYPAVETGGVFVRVNGELFFTCGNSFEKRADYRIYSKVGMKEARFRYPDGGFRGWGCVMPVKLGSRTRCFWLTFDRHNGSCYQWSYGNFYCFEAEE